MGDRRSTRWALAKLQATAPELHGAVLSGQLSLNRAMIQAGLREPQTTVKLNPVDLARVALSSFTALECQVLVEHIHAGLSGHPRERK